LRSIKRCLDKKEEMEAIQDEVERIQLITLLNKYGNSVKVNLKKTRQRAEELVALGFGVADAAHVAFEVA